MYLRIDLAVGAGGIGEECEGLPSLAPGQLPRQGQEAYPLRLLDVGEQRRALLQIRAGVRPAGGGQRIGEAQEGGAVLAAEGGEDVRRDAQTVSGQVVGAVAERIDEAYEDARLRQRQVPEQRRAAVEELHRQRGGAPGALVELTAQAHPVAQPLHRHLRQRPRRGAEVGSGQRRGNLGQVAAVLRPAAELREAELRQHLRSDTEVLSRRFPGAPGLPRQLQPLLRPLDGLFRRKEVLHRLRRPAEIANESRGERG